MSEELPDDWSWKPLGEFAEVVSGGTPSKNEPSYWDGGTIPWATPSDITKTSGRVIFDTEEKITDLGLSASAASRLPAGSILMTSRATLGEARIAAVPTATNQGFKSLVPKAHIDNWYLFYQIQNSKSRYSVFGKGTTFLEVNTKDTLRLPIPYCPKNEQRRIATILTTLDEEIEATEALIAKHQQIKAGLMHDLFTRGLWTQAELARGDHKGLPCEATAKEGHLRPTPEEAPGLYQQTDIGLIPNAWRCEQVASLLANTAVPMRSGPFGSALLKDELVENGIPLLGIDNVFVERFEPTFRRFVSPWKFLELSRYEAFAGDVVITIMGTVGRCCVIPDGIGQALSSKHLWTMTFDTEQILPDLVCWQLNHAAWVKNWFLRHAQGAVMDAIQSSTLRTLHLPVPPIAEQREILARYRSISNSIETDLAHLAKLRQQKQGLMHDLLTGRARVTPDSNPSLPL